MVTLVARQSVILKCNMKASEMLGNYEFYYGAGLFCRLSGTETEQDILPGALREKILPALTAFSSGDEREMYLKKLLLAYIPSEAYDEQMKELLLWGLSEEKLWVANVYQGK